MPTTLIKQQDGPQIRPSQLRPGPVWASFEQFRMAGPSGPEAVGGGQAGTLRTKGGLFRLPTPRGVGKARLNVFKAD
jgi:hypothetical protein